MAISAEKYIMKNKVELLKLYSAFYAGLELDTYIYENVLEKDIKKKACELASLCHKYANSDLEFSINKNILITKTDEYIIEELYSVVLCEEQVKIGKLTREGDFYMSSSSEDFKTIPRYKKYIRVK
jgi:hypothetical protein